MHSNALVNIVQKPHNFTEFKENRESSQQGRIRKVHNMQITQKLPTNKSNFPLKHTEDLYHIKHTCSNILTYYIINNISYYFNSFSFLED